MMNPLKEKDERKESYLKTKRVTEI